MAVPTAPLKRWLAALRNDNAQGEYYLTDIVAMAVADGVPVVTAQARERSRGARREQPAAARRPGARVQRAQAEALMEAGVRLADPARLDVRGELVCGSDVEIDVNCVFEGRVSLGDGVRIGANCVIRNAAIGERALIQPFTHIDGDALGVSVGAGSLVGPFARLRPGAVLGRGRARRQLRRGQEQHAGARREGEPPRLPGRRERRRARQLRRRQHHRQLRRREQAPHGDRRRRAHRLELRARRAGDRSARARRSAAARRSATTRPPGSSRSRARAQVTLPDWKRPARKT